jgi:hypothetical protein
MSRRISVEPGLAAVKAHLHQCGYEIVDMAECVRPVEAVVYAGPPLTDAPTAIPAAENTVLVNACGLSPAEVAAQLDTKLS